MVRQEDAVLVLFRMREVVLCSSLSGNSQCFGHGRSHAGSTGTAAAHRSHSRPLRQQPQSIMEEQKSRRELYDGLKRLTQREQTYLLYR